jgi:hypothetical protein
MIGTGQHPRGNKLGDWVYKIVTQPDVNIIVESGTWKGGGTTKCIYDGIIDGRKKKYEVYSFEINKSFYAEAVCLYKQLPPLKNFNLIYGSLLTYEEQLPYRDVDYENDYQMDKTVALGWLNGELSHLKNAPLVIDKVPEKIDLLILDGSFATELEFKKLYERSTYFVLDDTFDIKNKNNRIFILNRPEMFQILEDNIALHFLICKKIS